MGTISVSLPSDGETADVADYNTPITTIVNEINGGLDNANIASDAAIDGSKLADDSVPAAKIAEEAWQSWTPTLSGRFTDGDWSKDCKYIQIGNTVFFRFFVKATDSTPMGGGSGNATFTLPVTAASYPGSILGTIGNVIGNATFFDAAPSLVQGLVRLSSTTTADIMVRDASGTYGNTATVTSTVPFTWTTNDEIACEGFYEAA